MSRKSTTDRRAQATERSLHKALSELVREKDYDEIPVREILSRANVGRSTFYAHFDGKDALLTSGIEHIISTADRGSPMSFSLPVFEHHQQHRDTGRMNRRSRALLHEHLRVLVARRVRDDLNRRRPGNGTPVPTDLLAQLIASTFVIVLDWWLDTRSALSAKEVNDLFVSLVAAAVRWRGIDARLRLAWCGFTRWRQWIETPRTKTPRMGVDQQPQPSSALVAHPRPFALHSA